MTGKQIGAGTQSPVTRYVVLLITGAGICLVLYSSYMAVMHVNELNRLVLDLIMFGFGFAAIWFGLTHFDIQKTESRIQKINQKADRIREILDRK